jgi:hypothetical protein
MSVHRVTDNERTPLLMRLIPEHIRAWDLLTVEEPDLVITFTPDLTPDETADLAWLAIYTRADRGSITPAEWLALKAAVTELRTLRTRTAAEWSAMTAAQRDNALVQWCRDITDVLRALIRD